MSNGLSGLPRFWWMLLIGLGSGVSEFSSRDLSVEAEQSSCRGLVVAQVHVGNGVNGVDKDFSRN